MFLARLSVQGYHVPQTHGEKVSYLEEWDAAAAMEAQIHRPGAGFQAYDLPARQRCTLVIGPPVTPESSVITGV